jgi:hypothetical protein
MVELDDAAVFHCSTSHTTSFKGNNSINVGDDVRGMKVSGSEAVVSGGGSLSPSLRYLLLYIYTCVNTCTNIYVSFAHIHLFMYTNWYIRI